MVKKNLKAVLFCEAAFSFFIAHALDAFKVEYLLDFININPDEDERVLETEIVNNIKHFILSL